MKRLRKLEPRYTKALKTVLLQQYEVAIVLLSQFPEMPSPAGIELIAARINGDGLLAPLKSLYVACGEAEAADTYEHLTRRQKAQAPAATKTSWAARLRAFITTEGAAAVRGITETTRKAVRDVLNQSAAAGDSIQTAAARLRARVAQLAPQRARRIARTELLTASNFGSLMGAQATGLKLDKFWLATPGARTRPSHRNADLQTVGMADVFTVGGYTARYPGDPLLPAKERANCRCTVAYKARES